MTINYRMKPTDNQLTVFDDLGEHVGTCLTEEAAEQDIERRKKEDAMYEAVKLLVDIAIKAHMKRLGVDRETASYWIRSAAQAAN